MIYKIQEGDKMITTQVSTTSIVTYVTAVLQYF